jgi:hypothetical protein
MPLGPDNAMILNKNMWSCITLSDSNRRYRFLLSFRPTIDYLLQAYTDELCDIATMMANIHKGIIFAISKRQRQMLLFIQKSKYASGF